MFTCIYTHIYTYIYIHIYSTEATFTFESVGVPWLEATMRLQSGIYGNACARVLCSYEPSENWP